MSQSPLPTSGSILRARREELGLSLDAVAQRTRIRRTYLEALEEDCPQAFPGETYRAGFLRTYAALLGITVEPSSPENRSSSPPEKMPDMMVSRPRRRSDKGIFALAAAILLIAGAIMSAALFRNSGDPPPEAVSAPPAAPAAAPSQPVPAPSEPVQETELAASVDDAVAAEAADASPSPGTEPAPSETEVPAMDEAAVAAAVPVTSPAPVPTPSAEPSPVAAAAAAPPESPAPAATAAPSPDPSAATNIAPSFQETNVIRLQALGTNRLELILDNRPPQRYELKADTELSWKVRRSALIRVDDPAGVRLWLGERPLDLQGKTQILVQTDAGREN